MFRMQKLRPKMVAVVEKTAAAAMVAAMAAMAAAMAAVKAVAVAVALGIPEDVAIDSETPHGDIPARWCRSRL